MAVNTVLVTGAAQGIGASTSRLLAERGSRIIGVDLQADVARESITKLNAEVPVDDPHLYFGANVANETEVEALFSDVEQEVGSLDGVVNCAGNLIRGDAQSMDLSDWKSQIETHVIGTFLISRNAIKLMPNGTAAIVNVASVGATFGLPGRSAYTTAKTGIIGLTRTLAVEWGSRGVRVNAIAPGYINTEMMQSGIDNGSLDPARLLDRTPLGRLGETKEVATAIAFLLSEEASFVNGHVLRVDGGITIDGKF